MNRGLHNSTSINFTRSKISPQSLSRKGYSVIESIVVLGLVALISASAFIIINDRTAGSEAASARASLIHLLKLQASNAAAPFADVNVLSELDPGREYLDGSSSNPNIVSVLVDSQTRLAAATVDGADCWMFVKDFAATTIATREIWLVEKNSATCSAARAIQVGTPDQSGVTGQSSNRPRII